jgi:hypothetical protein
VIEEYKKGDMVKAMVLDVDSREGAHLARRQAARPAIRQKQRMPEARQEGRTVTCTKSPKCKDGGIEVKIADSDLTSFVKRPTSRAIAPISAPSASASWREGRRPVIQFDKQGPPHLQVSIKALEIAEEKEAVGSLRLVGLGRIARRHPGRRAQGPREELTSSRPEKGRSVRWTDLRREGHESYARTAARPESYARRAVSR